MTSKTVSKKYLALIKQVPILPVLLNLNLDYLMFKKNKQEVFAGKKAYLSALLLTFINQFWS
jgi:hypothetical protein